MFRKEKNIYSYLKTDCAYSDIFIHNPKSNWLPTNFIQYLLHLVFLMEIYITLQIEKIVLLQLYW